MKRLPMLLLRMTISFGIAILISSCFLQRLVSAPKRSFSASDLLVNGDELPQGWMAPYGGKNDTDNTKPRGSVTIDLYKPPMSDIADITQRVSIFKSIEHAKNYYSERAQFHGETNISGWSFISKIADEQKFSCYTYPNLDYPICTWLGRYQEITIEVIGRLEPGRVTLEEMQAIVKMIDEKTVRNLAGK